MNALYSLDATSILSVLFVFFRALGLMFMTPVFSHVAIPWAVRAALGLSLSVAIYPIVQRTLPTLGVDLQTYFFQGMFEIAIGALMGFAGAITFEGILMAAQFAGVQLGLGTAALQDPTFHNASVLVPLQSVVLWVLFFLLDMHHQVLAIFVQSFEVTRQIHIDSLLGPQFLVTLIAVTAKLFTLAVQAAAPLTALSLAAQAAFAILARFVPQMNVMIFSFPITIALLFLVLYLTANEFFSFCEWSFGEGFRDPMILVRGLLGG